MTLSPILNLFARVSLSESIKIARARRANKFQIEQEMSYNFPLTIHNVMK